MRLWTLSIVLIVATPAFAERPIVEEDRRHWAFIPPTRPDVPSVGNSDRLQNPIDAFLTRRLEAEGLAYSPEADRATLLRRLSFDLNGLPPRPEEINAFLADAAPDAYERQVDRLLASPHYGERWAQHWLDLARHADTDGFEFDDVRPSAWRYRDWVVRALNADLPYDQFVALQMAGDERKPDDPDAAIATGFHRAYPDMVDQNDQALRRQNALDDITETTGLAFLGLTIGCARCHDHKTDPIRQVDFYQLQAFFSPARFRDDYPLASETETARVLDEAGADAPVTLLRKRGDFYSPGPAVSPAFPAVLSSATATVITASARSSGRRTALANWLIQADHPLTSRVIVNRLWQHHFGRGLVATPSDFGLMGDDPSHPKLLDWLATELIADGWSLKAMHRRIVTSAAYRQSSGPNEAAAAIDPENALLWRQSRRRLEGEAIRDAVLAACERLNSKMEGPGIFPELPAELSKLSSRGAAWPVTTDRFERDRRSLYVFVRRNLRYPFFESFDRPDPNASCPQRPVTTIAPQALSMLNSRLTAVSARDLAASIAGETNDPSAQIKAAYQRTLGRSPDAEEQGLALEFLSNGGTTGLADLALVLFNLNEFVMID